MRVAIDTNIFHNDRSLSGGNFEVLTRLAEAGYVEILIPEVVAKEFTTPSSEQIEGTANLREAIKGIRSAFPKKFISRIDALKKDVRELSRSLESEVRSTFDQWMQRVKGRVINPGGEHAQRILTKYFDGTPPFGSRKARNDFPGGAAADVQSARQRAERAAVAAPHARLALAETREGRAGCSSLVGDARTPAPTPSGHRRTEGQRGQHVVDPPGRVGAVEAVGFKALRTSCRGWLIRLPYAM